MQTISACTSCNIPRNFPSTVRADVFGLGGGIRNVTHFGRTVLLAIEGTVASVTASVDYVKSAGRAKMDVYTAKRKTVAASFRFIRYLNDAKEMKSGTVLAPPYAEELVRVLNRLFMPSANIVHAASKTPHNS